MQGRVKHNSLAKNQPCDICGMMFHDFDEMKIHRRNAHPGVPRLAKDAA